MKYLFIIALIISLPLRADTITIAADPWCPYNCDPNDERQGSMIDVAREALALSGHTLEYQIINWARAKNMVKAGSIDAIVGMGKSYDNENDYIFPDQALGISQVCFFKRKGDAWTYESPSSLEELKYIGWINDYGISSDKSLDEWIKANKNSQLVNHFSGLNLHKRMLSALELNRIDTFPEDRNVIMHELEKHQLQNKISIAGCSKHYDTVYVAFSLKLKQSKRWAQDLTSGVKQLKENGRLNEILSRYGLNTSTWLSD